MSILREKIAAAIDVERRRLAGLRHKCLPGEDGNAFFARICRLENDALAKAVLSVLDVSQRSDMADGTPSGAQEQGVLGPSGSDRP